MSRTTVHPAPSPPWVTLPPEPLLPIRDLHLHDLALRLDDPDHHFGRAVEVLAHFGARPSPAAPSAAAMRWSVGSQGSAPPRPAEGAAVRHRDVLIGRDPAGLLLGWPGGVARLADGDGHVTLWPEGPEPLPVHVFTCLLVHQLRARGWYTLHAACVEQGGRALLVVGPSGSGKSTLTLALARSGWRLVSDDSVLLREGPGGIEALALRRGLFLDPRSFPGSSAPGRWRPCPLLEGTKQELVVEALERSDRARPAALLLPTLGHGPRSEFQAADLAQATYALARESRLAELDRQDTPAHLAMLARLAGQARPLLGSLGRDVPAAAPSVSQGLQALLAEAA